MRALSGNHNQQSAYDDFQIQYQGHVLKVVQIVEDLLLYILNRCIVFISIVFPALVPLINGSSQITQAVKTL